jgi:biopolymer transport protein ExbD
MRIRFQLPEPGLSRAALCCLAGSFLLILGFFFYAGIWWPAWRVYEVTGSNPRIDPPLSVMAEWEHDPEDRWILSVAGDARLWRKGKPCDFADLGASLHEATLGFAWKQRTEGKSALEELPGGGSASNLILLLRVDRAAPWGAVHDVMCWAGEQGLCRLQFLARPADAWFSKVLGAWLPSRAERDAAIAIRVRRAPDGAVAYSHGHFEAPDAMSFREQLRARREEDPEGRAVGAIRAPRDVPFQAIVGAMDAFAAAGFWRVDFYVEDASGNETRAEVVPR